MCSIVGLQGNFKADDLIVMLKTSKNRGKDASGIFLDGKIQKGIDLNDFNDENAYSLGLGHNLLAVHNLENRTSLFTYRFLPSYFFTVKFTSRVLNICLSKWPVVNENVIHFIVPH